MKIGNVSLNLDYYDDKYVYADGAEDALLEIVKNGSDIKSALKNSKNWPILYHLHPHRTNILRWYQFLGNEEVLEIGSGCGALSGLLAEKCKSLVCNDISLKRSQVNAHRNKNFDNIEIYVSNFMDMPKGEYDIITLIGVLEYAQSYVGGENPFSDMLKRLYAMLRKGGRLLLAIENRFGLKYWAGCREDHLGTYYSGIEGYKNGGPIRTFSRRELKALINGSGFFDMKFYYPMPDYKFAYEIYSDERLPDRGELKNLIHNYDSSRLYTFDEASVFDSVIDEGMFPFFANSFFVEATK